MTSKSLFVFALCAVAFCVAWYLAGPSLTLGQLSAGKPFHRRDVVETASAGANKASIPMQQTDVTSGDDSTLDERPSPPPPQPLSAKEMVFIKAFKKLGISESVLAKRAARENPDYRELFESLGCSPKQTSELMALLDQRRRAEAEALFEITKVESPTKADTSRVNQSKKAAFATYTEKIAGVLADPVKIQRFHEWEQTSSERQRIAGMEERLGRTFSTTEVERMVDVFQGSRLNVTRALMNQDDQVLRNKILQEWQGKLSGILTPAEMADVLTRMTTPKARPSKTDTKSQP